MPEINQVNILHLIGGRGIGGTEINLMSLVKGLNSPGFRNIVCCLNDQSPLIKALKEYGINTRCLGMNSKKDLRGIKRFAAILKEENVHIIHTWLFFSDILGRLVGRWMKIPFIVSAQESIDEWKRWHHRQICRWTSPLVDLFIANSLAVKSCLIEKEKIREEKIIVIPAGLATPNFNNLRDKETMKAQLGLKQDGFIIGVVANLYPYKGHKYLLEAFSQVIQGLPDTQLIIIGDGSQRLSLGKMVRSNNLQDQVVFLGQRTDIPELLAIMDLFVLPSLWEGFPRAILEAMACGKPIIASRVGGIPEMVTEGENGFLVPPKSPKDLAEAIICLLKDEKLRIEMGLRNKQKVETEYSYQTYLKKMTKVYEDLIAGRFCE